jgi:hypothetical protein
MKTKKKLFIAISLLLLLLAGAYSCTKGNVQDLSGSGGGGSTCDTTNMTYTADVVPILQANCYVCHGSSSNSGSGGIILEGYANLKPYATNGDLVGNITWAPGHDPMPENAAKLPTCEINTIIDWVNRGAQNN